MRCVLFTRVQCVRCMRVSTVQSVLYQLTRTRCGTENQCLSIYWRTVTVGKQPSTLACASCCQLNVRALRALRRASMTVPPTATPRPSAIVDSFSLIECIQSHSHDCRGRSVLTNWLDIYRILARFQTLYIWNQMLMIIIIHNTVSLRFHCSHSAVFRMVYRNVN